MKPAYQKHKKTNILKPMKKITIALFIVISSLSLKAQATDSVIVHAVLGRYYYEIPKILDSLKVWHHAHLVEKVAKSVRWYSIEDANKAVKVYKFNLTSEAGYVVNEVVINYRHDSREQVEASLKITDADDYHVGTYSTDLVFKLKK